MEAALRSHRGETVLALGCLVLILLTSTACKSHRSAWTYSLSRDFYDSKNWHLSEPVAPWPNAQGGGAAGVWIVALFALPFVIDTAILPITVTHDLLAAR